MKKVNLTGGGGVSNSLAFIRSLCHPEFISGSKILKRVQNDKVSGFTLAEVLITLAIIGVVAALTIPTVVKNYQKQQTIAKLKKAWSMISQAYNMSQAQNGMYQTWDKAVDIGTAQYFNQYWKPYLKVSKVCTSYSDCGYKALAPWKHSNGNNSTTNVVSTTSRTTFLTPDGILFIIFTSSGSLAVNDSVIIDLNGSKEPNVFGKDLFRFTRTDKGILPNCYATNNMTTINNNCSKTGAGDCCAAKLSRDGWEMKDNYPW